MNSSSPHFSILTLLGFVAITAVGSSSAQAAPKLAPVSPDICQSTQFYQVKTADSSPLRAWSDRQLKNSVASIASGTTIIDTAGGFSSYLIPGRKEVVYLNSSDVKRNLVKLKFGSKFTGRMRVKTLRSGCLFKYSQTAQAQF